MVSEKYAIYYLGFRRLVALSLSLFVVLSKVENTSSLSSAKSYFIISSNINQIYDHQIHSCLML